MLAANKQMEVINVKIGDIQYYIKKFPAFKAARLSGELSALIGPIVGAVAGVFSLAGKDGMIVDPAEEHTIDLDNIEAEDLANVLSNALSDISGEKIEKLMKELLINNMNVSFTNPETMETEQLTKMTADELFCGDVQDMYLLCYEVIKANYKNFFGKILPRFGLRFKTMTTKGAVQSTSTENSTDSNSENSN